jgi:predicted signal transduction protein with EAL and GGDEF domain
LGLRVVAEGVETLKQMEALNRLGCTLVQGFLVSKPQPANDVERWLETTVRTRNAPWILAANEFMRDPSIAPVDEPTARLVASMAAAR